MQRTRPRGGFTLIELMVTITLSAVLAGSLGTAMQRALQLYRNSSADLQLERKMEATVQRLRSELRNASVSTVAPVPVTVTPGITPWTAQIRYQSVDAWGVDDVVLGPFTSISTRLDPAEIDDGVDQDGDGLVDELDLMLTLDVGAANPTTIVLASGVLEWFPGETGDMTDENGNGLEDEPGYSVTVDGSTLTIRLALAEFRPEGTTAIRTRTIRMTLAN